MYGRLYGTQATIKKVSLLHAGEITKLEYALHKLEAIYTSVWLFLVEAQLKNIIYSSDNQCNLMFDGLVISSYHNYSHHSLYGN